MQFDISHSVGSHLPIQEWTLLALKKLTWKVTNSGARRGVFLSAVLCKRKTLASISKDRI